MSVSLATTELKSISGFHRFVKWVKQRGLKRAAVTNAPRENAEQILNALGVIDFFDILVVGSECKNPKPFPDPYLHAIKHLDVEPNQTIVLEVICQKNHYKYNFDVLNDSSFYLQGHRCLH